MVQPLETLADRHMRLGLLHVNEVARIDTSRADFNPHINQLHTTAVSKSPPRKNKDQSVGASEENIAQSVSLVSRYYPQEEMTIRAMTCRGRRRRNCDNSHRSCGGDEPCELFSYPGGPRTTTEARLPSTSPARPMTSSLKCSINNNDPNRNLHTRAETAAAREPGRRREVYPEQRDSEEDAVGVVSAPTDAEEEFALPPSRLNPRALGHR